MAEKSLETGTQPTPKPISVGFVNAELPPKSRSLSTQIRALLVDCPSKESLFEKLLQICSEQLPTTVARIDFRIGDTMQSRMTHDPRMAKALAERFSSEYLAPLSESTRQSSDTEPKLKGYERGDQKMTLIAAPIIDIATGKIEAVVSLMLGGGTYKSEVVLPRLDGIAAVAAAVLVAKSRSLPNTASSTTRVAEPPPAVAPAAALTAGGAAATADPPQPQAVPSAEDVASGHRGSALAKAAQFSSTKEFGYSLVNSLCGQLQAEQIFFGVTKHGRIEVEAVSGVPDFKAHGPGVTAARQAMEECLDNAAIVVAQHAQPEGLDAMPIHKQWATETNNSCVCSLPLMDNDQVAGVITVRRPTGKPFKKEEAAGLAQMLAPYGAALRVVEKANRTVGKQLKTAVGDSARKNLGKGALGRKFAFGAIALGLLWFFFGSMMYRPLCRTRVTASNMRHFSAPFDGKLQNVYVHPGQIVKQGTLLAEFDTADLQLQLNSLSRQMSTRQVEFRQAISDDKMPEAALAKSQVTVLKTQASAIKKQISDAKLVAPVDGTVLLSDLEQRIGQVFPQGEEILQFAEDGEWLLEIEVPDDIANYVSPKQSGTFAAASYPTEKQPFAIEHIDGAATMMQDRNVFIARAPLAARPDWMRTGMEGTARVDTVSRPVWWVAMHRVVDWGRMNFWL